MASIATRQPGSQAESIVSNYAKRNQASVVSGLGVEWGDVAATSITRGFDFLGQRFGTPAGTLVQQADGSMIYRQPTGSMETLPISSRQLAVQTSEGFSTGIATGTLMMVGAGVLVLFLLMGKRR